MKDRSILARAISVTDTREERAQLEAINRSRSLSHGIVRRAKIILGSADGVGATELAHRYQISRPTVAPWRKRWSKSRISGVHTELRPGRPRLIRRSAAAPPRRKHYPHIARIAMNAVGRRQRLLGDASNART